MLDGVIEDWETCAPVQRAICRCLLRGDDMPDKIARSLGLTADDVRGALQGVWGALHDRTRDKLFIR